MVMSKWTKHVTNYFRNMRKTNKNYKFKDAMTDARKSYKKMSGGEVFTVNVEGNEGVSIAPAATATGNEPAAAAAAADTTATGDGPAATAIGNEPAAAAADAADTTATGDGPAIKGGGKKSKKSPSRKSMRVNKKGGKKGRKSSKRNGKK